MHLGIHCSVRNGYLAAVEEARAHGVKAMQLLPYKRHHEPAEADFAVFREARRAAGIERVLVHSRYLPALATDDAARRANTVRHLVREFAMAASLEADAYVLHIGAYAPGSTFAEGMALFCKSLEEARQEVEPLPVYIENVPGGGRRVGGTAGELARLLEAARKVWPETFLCVDTAHAWASGAELESFEALGDGIRAWHLNDTLAEKGSCLESHWHLGEGKIGEDAMRRLLRRLAVRDVTVILETPKEAGADRRNLDWALERLG